jgi:hypothetical protein
MKGQLSALCFGLLALMWFPARLPMIAEGQTKAAPESAKLVIGRLKTKGLSEGCGCGFYYPSDSRSRSPKFIFSSDDQNFAWMNIGGQDIELKLLRSTDPKVIRVGSRSTRIYRASGIKVTVSFVTTWICPPRDEACEVTRYNGTFTLTKGGLKRVVILKGDCGC